MKQKSEVEVQIVKKIVNVKRSHLKLDEFLCFQMS